MVMCGDPDQVGPPLGFHDPVNPTATEITAWAYSGEPEPMEDWDLILSADDEHMWLVQDLVADPKCANRSCLLRVLYLFAGDIMRSYYRTAAVLQQLDELVDRAERLSEPWIRTWAERTRNLMRVPEKFDYTAWCDGGLAGDPVGHSLLT